MNLVIIITGLVLLAPDRENDRLHLFFPQMDLVHPKAQHHVPYLEYLTAQAPAREPLGGWTLDLGTLTRPGSAPALPAEVIDIRGMFSGGVPRSWVTGTPPSRVQGRLSLPWPDSFGKGNTARWLLRRGVAFRFVTLTNAVVVEYEMPLSQPPAWMLSSLPTGPGGTKSIPAYRPGGSGDTIRISNLPPGEETKLGYRDEGVHFQGYVDLLRLRLIDRLRPRPRVFLDELPGLSPFNCMVASASVRD